MGRGTLSADGNDLSVGGPGSNLNFGLNVRRKRQTLISAGADYVPASPAT